MRERAELAGGWCQVHSLPDSGTTVQFWLPATALTSVGQIEPDDADRSSDGHPTRSLPDIDVRSASL
jgi:hypothetical protein